LPDAAYVSWPLSVKGARSGIGGILGRCPSVPAGATRDNTENGPEFEHAG
jgi:hypothetical protein